MNIVTINLERGYPRVDEAILHLNSKVAEAKRSGIKYMRVIHGYGSTGVGGGIKIGAQGELGKLLGRGTIRRFIPGENLNTDGVNGFPLLRELPEYNKGNRGITIVIF
jgi:hypothetical protein